MAIFRRDRSFSKIINEVDVETIPVHFIKRLKLTLFDGRMEIIEGDELSDAPSMEALLMTKEYVSEIMDMAIELDFDLIETDVTDQVNRLLNFKDKKDD
jgi:protein-L-isoaspartate O-methyltransferase